MKNPLNERRQIDDGIIARAQGCLLGQLAGDALGSLVEFQGPEQIRKKYPNGVRDLIDGGTWGTLAGQPTDDSEMALMLARMLVDRGTYNRQTALEAYLYWLKSGPFDCGATIGQALQGNLKIDSQANGAMMRISPLGIFGANFSLEQVAVWARQDAALTHPHPICLQANALFAMAIAYAIRMGCGALDIFQQIDLWAKSMNAEEKLLEVITGSVTKPPADYIHQQGWVLTAFQNTLWQLLHTQSLEEGVIDTVMQGGDTDTNAAICGALLGAVYGCEAIPKRWIDCLLNCRPEAGRLSVRRPRPKCFWPVDALILAEKLVMKN